MPLTVLGHNSHKMHNMVAAMLKKPTHALEGSGGLECKVWMFSLLLQWRRGCPGRHTLKLSDVCHLLTLYPECSVWGLLRFVLSPVCAGTDASLPFVSGLFVDVFFVPAIVNLPDAVTPQP